MTRENGGNLLSFFLGFLLGAFLALLFTPWKGEDVRGKIKETIEKTKEKLGELKEREKI